ncbi:MAG TPA: RING finger protein [Ignavibacteria bacterium]|nr:RING finger protein [Ignavibacteria bacterium]
MDTPQIKYDFLKNKTCPYCQSKIKQGADSIVCPNCGTPHHKECWNENLGCTTYGCKNNPLTENKIEFDTSDPLNSENVGDLTIDSIKDSMMHNRDVKTISCPNCKSVIEESSVYCKFCGYSLKENKLPEAESDAKNDFEKEYKKRYKDKVGISRKRFYMTLASFIILISVISFLFYTSITKLNTYFSSDEYRIKNTIDNWRVAWENEDINKFGSYMTEDYEYYGKDRKKIDLKERLKRIEWTFKNYKDIKIKFSDMKIISDSASTENDKMVMFQQEYESDKFSEKGVKTLGMYKGSETNGEWKIYREYFE